MCADSQHINEDVGGKKHLVELQMKTIISPCILSQICSFIYKIFTKKKVVKHVMKEKPLGSLQLAQPSQKILNILKIVAYEKTKLDKLTTFLARLTKQKEKNCNNNGKTQNM